MNRRFFSPLPIPEFVPAFSGAEPPPSSPDWLVEYPTAHRALSSLWFSAPVPQPCFILWGKPQAAARPRHRESQLEAVHDDLTRRDAGLPCDVRAFDSAHPQRTDLLPAWVVPVSIRHTFQRDIRASETSRAEQLTHDCHRPSVPGLRRHDCNRFWGGMPPCRKGTPSRTQGTPSSAPKPNAPAWDACATRRYSIQSSRIFSACLLRFAPQVRRTPGRTASSRSGGCPPTCYRSPLRCRSPPYRPQSPPLRRGHVPSFSLFRSSFIHLAHSTTKRRHFSRKPAKKVQKRRSCFWRSSSRFHFAPPFDGSCLIFHRDMQKHTKTPVFWGFFVCFGSSRAGHREIFRARFSCITELR